MIYLLTIYEYGGTEIEFCWIECKDPEFAKGFEKGISLWLDQDLHYTVLEEISKANPEEGCYAIVRPWVTV